MGYSTTQETPAAGVLEVFLGAAYSPGVFILKNLNLAFSTPGYPQGKNRGNRPKM